MADEKLASLLELEARPITASDLPSDWPFPLVDFILRTQDSDKAIIEKANEASFGAYEAQLSGDENTKSLTEVNNLISTQDIRIKTVEDTASANSKNIALINRQVSDSSEAIEGLDERVSFLEEDYISITETVEQSLASPLNVTDSYSVNGVKVVGTRETGWTSAIGTAYKGAFDANQAYTVSVTYTQAEVQAIADGLIEARKRVKALEDALRSHGLIN